MYLYILITFLSINTSHVPQEKAKDVYIFLTNKLLSRRVYSRRVEINEESINKFNTMCIYRLVFLYHTNIATLNK